MRAGDRNAALWQAIEKLADHGELCATLDQLARTAELTKDQIRSGLGDLVATDLLRPAGKRGQISIYQITDFQKSHGPVMVVDPNTPIGGMGSNQPIPTDRAQKSHGPDERIMQAAENRIGSCLLHFDRESEVIEDLFGRRGLLRAFAGDEALERRMLALWRGARHQGERLEAELDERMAGYRAARLRRSDGGSPEPPLEEGLPIVELVKRNGNGNGHATIDEEDLGKLLGWDEA